jgi:hypothetical protein
MLYKLRVNGGIRLESLSAELVNELLPFAGFLPAMVRAMFGTRGKQLKYPSWADSISVRCIKNAELRDVLETGLNRLQALPLHLRPDGSCGPSNYPTTRSATRRVMFPVGCSCYVCHVQGVTPIDEKQLHWKATVAGKLTSAR